MNQNLTTSLLTVMYRNLGTSGLRISAVGIRTTSADTLARFCTEGGSLIDATAASSRAIAAIGAHNLVVATRVGVDLTKPAGKRVDCSRKNLITQLDNFLAVSDLDHVDLVMAGHFDTLTPPDEVAAALNYAVESGRAHYAGVAGYRGWQLAVTDGVISAAHEYSLVRRAAEEELIPAAQHLGVGVIADDPLATGEAVTTAAEGLGVAPATVALSWVLARVDAAVVKLEKPEQVADVMKVAALPGAIDRALEDVSRVG